MAGDWMQFRGPGGSARNDDKGIPDKWSATENVLWKTKLPGPGSSCPITVGNAIYLTCYSGYEDAKEAGDQKDLLRHLVCLDHKSGSIRWTKDIKPELPELEYKAGNDAQQDYASSTPVSDGEHVYVFFGKTGVFCFDLKGEQVWSASVGKGKTKPGCEPEHFAAVRNLVDDEKLVLILPEIVELELEKAWREFTNEMTKEIGQLEQRVTGVFTQKLWTEIVDIQAALLAFLREKKDQKIRAAEEHYKSIQQFFLCPKFAKVPFASTAFHNSSDMTNLPQASTLAVREAVIHPPISDFQTASIFGRGQPGHVDSNDRPSRSSLLGPTADAAGRSRPH